MFLPPLEIVAKYVNSMVVSALIIGALGTIVIAGVSFLVVYACCG